MSTTNYNSYYTCYIATASIAVATEYNKNPDADFIAIEHEHMDAIAEYFKGKPVIAYIGQPIGSNKSDIGSMTAEEMKRMLNKVYGATKYNQGGYSV